MTNTLTLTTTANTDVTLPTTGTLATLAGSETLSNKTLATAQFSTSLVPDTDDGAALGSTSKKISDLFLASGAVINFNNGNCSITHDNGSNALIAYSNFSVNNNIYAGNIVDAAGAYVLSSAFIIKWASSRLIFQCANSQEILSGGYSADTYVSPARNDSNNFGDVVIQGGSERARFVASGNTELSKVSGKNGFRVETVASQVNHLNALASATGNAVQLQALGDDTNIDLGLTPKGSGNVKFGTHSGLSGETVSGYITIKDAGGTTRKIAVVS